MRRFLLGGTVVALLAGGSLLAEQGWLTGKAALARLLIDRAYRAHLSDGEAHPPWRWADTWPIARLEVPRLGLRRTVLAGASGASMTFGPGHVDGTARPNRRGNCALAGHRDGSFAFLERLSVGDELILEALPGRRRYVVTRVAVHRDSDTSVLERTDDDRLTLITCYPFDRWDGSADRRYVVIAEPGSGAPRPSRSPHSTIRN